MPANRLFSAVALAFAVCAPSQAGQGAGQSALTGQAPSQTSSQAPSQGVAVCSLPSLPAPRTNNAVASLTKGGETYLLSALGLGPAKDYTDTHKDAYLLRVGNKAWSKLDDVPVANGRLAGTAVAAGGKFWILGGYSVAADGSEVSEPEVFSLDPVTKHYERRADMPVPVDDAVALVYADRYIYVVSGWHDVGNVSFIQMYDTETDTWTRASLFSGWPVFGHAGAIIDNLFVVIDGVGVTGMDGGRRKFGMRPQAWYGTINPDAPENIAWKTMPQHPGGPLYRVAAGGFDGLSMLLFTGGSETAYNFDGTGYSGTPAQPTNKVLGWNLLQDRWETLEDKAVPTMDHRGLVRVGDVFFTLGGMGAGQKVLAGAHVAYSGGLCETPVQTQNASERGVGLGADVESEAEPAQAPATEPAPAPVPTQEPAPAREKESEEEAESDPATDPE